MPDKITPAQRRGALLGSAVATALGAMTGRDPIDAVVRGVSSGFKAYGGGVEGVLNRRREEEALAAEAQQRALQEEQTRNNMGYVTAQRQQMEQGTRRRQQEEDWARGLMTGPTNVHAALSGYGLENAPPDMIADAIGGIIKQQTKPAEYGFHSADGQLFATDPRTGSASPVAGGQKASYKERTRHLNNGTSVMEVSLDGGRTWKQEGEPYERFKESAPPRPYVQFVGFGQDGAPVAWDARKGELHGDASGGVMPKTLSKPSAGQQDFIGNIETLEGQLAQTKEMFKDDYVGIASGRAGRVTSQFNKEESYFRSLVDDMKNTLLYMRSGAQINEEEYKRIAKTLPNYTDHPEKFWGNWQRTIDSIGMLKKNRMGAMRSSNTMAPSGKNAQPAATGGAIQWERGPDGKPRPKR